MGYNSYRVNQGDISYTVTSDDHSGTKLIDANNKISSLASSVAKLEIMVQAMFEIMTEQGISPELINAKIIEITDRDTGKGNVPDNTQACPRCGKTVKELANAPLTGRCMYCGKVIKFYPSFELPGQEKPEETPVDTDPFAQDQDPGFTGSI